MKIVLVTYGSRGDVQPMLALSLALQARGHRVLLAGPPEKADWASELGCPYVCLGEDVTAFVDSMPDSHSIRSALQFIAFVRRGVTRQFDLLPDLVSGADLVVGSALVFALASVADAAGIPYRYIVFAPQLLPSGGHPFPAIQTQNMPFWINRLTWQWASRLDLTGILRQIKARQRKMGLKPAPDVWQHILTPGPLSLLMRLLRLCRKTLCRVRSRPGICIWINPQSRHNGWPRFSRTDRRRCMPVSGACRRRTKSVPWTLLSKPPGITACGS